MPVIAIGLLAVSARFIPIAEGLRGMLEWTRPFGSLGVTVYALVYALAAMLCVPCLPLTIGAGILFGPVRGLLVVVCGTAVAAAGGFLAARHMHRGRILEWLRKKPGFRAVDSAINREGWKIVFLLRMVPLPFGLSNYFYGLTGLNLSYYLLATLGGMLPGNAVFVYLGSLGTSALSPERPVHPFEYVLAALSLVGLAGAGYIIKRRVIPEGDWLKE